MDDEEVILYSTGSMLKTMGYTVHSVSNPAEAVAVFEERTAARERFSAVILDLTIPGGPGGREALSEIRKLDQDAR